MPDNALVPRRNDLLPATREDLREIAAEVLAIFKTPSDAVLPKPGLFLRALTETLRRKNYPAPVIKEALQRAVETEPWTPAIATIVQHCETVQREERQKRRREKEKIKARRQAEEAKRATNQYWSDLRACYQKRFGTKAVKEFDQARLVVETLWRGGPFTSSVEKWKAAIEDGLPWAREAVELMTAVSHPEKINEDDQRDLEFALVELPFKESDSAADHHQKRLGRKYQLAFKPEEKTNPYSLAVLPKRARGVRGVQS